MDLINPVGQIHYDAAVSETTNKGSGENPNTTLLKSQLSLESPDQPEQPDYVIN